MRRLWTVAAVLFLALGLAPAPACARCSCVPMTEAQSFQAADLVFTGVLVGSETSADGVRLKFQPETVHKGSAGGGALILRTGHGDADCGWNHPLGHRYKIFALQERTSLCSGNIDLGPEPSARLDNSFPAVAAKTGVPAAWLTLGAVVLLAIAGAVALMWRRRRQDSA